MYIVKVVLTTQETDFLSCSSFLRIHSLSDFEIIQNLELYFMTNVLLSWLYGFFAILAITVENCEDLSSLTETISAIFTIDDEAVVNQFSPLISKNFQKITLLVINNNVQVIYIRIGLTR